jgi:isocitrate lyase
VTDPLDEDYLAAYARELQQAAFKRDFDRSDHCTRCGHPFHGLLCTAFAPASCPCPSAFKDAR